MQTFIWILIIGRNWPEIQLDAISVDLLIRVSRVSRFVLVLVRNLEILTEKENFLKF